MSFRSSVEIESQFLLAVESTAVANSTDLSMSNAGAEGGVLQMNFTQSRMLSSCQPLELAKVKELTYKDPRSFAENVFPSSKGRTDCGNPPSTGIRPGTTNDVT